jgi:hypothetical protein
LRAKRSTACCPTFQTWLDEAGTRGAAVLIAESRDGKPVFILQHRAVDLGNEEAVRSEHALSLVSEVRIRHCPWCGRRLEDWYRHHWRAFVRTDVPVIVIPELDG